jgi:transposase
MSETIRGHMKKHACDIDILPSVKAMVFNRLLEPSSKLRVYDWVKSQAIPEIYGKNIPLHYYYRSLDYLMTYKSSLEQDLFWKIADIFTLDLSLVFYDLTSSYFTGDCCEMAKYGYSRDHRQDCRQIEIGLLVNREGIPIAHEVWDGNIKDAKTVPETLKALSKRFNLKRCVFVGDNAMATPENIKLIRENHYEYIMSLKLLKDARAIRILKDTSLPKPEKFIPLTDNLLYHEVVSLGEGFQEGERVIVCYNPLRAQITHEKRQARIEESRQFLKSIVDKPPKQGKRKKPIKITAMVERALRKKETHTFFNYSFSPEGQFSFEEDAKAIEHARLTDGICMLLTNATNLSADDIARGYRTLTEVEHAFHEIKNFLRIRPIYHYKDLRVRGHVFVCVLAYLLETLSEKKLHESHTNLSARKALQMLKPIHMINYTIIGKSISKITKVHPEQKEIYNAIGVKYIPKTPAF